jgi:hypothetical protein
MAAVLQTDSRLADAETLTAGADVEQFSGRRGVAALLADITAVKASGERTELESHDAVGTADHEMSGFGRHGW